MRRAHTSKVTKRPVIYDQALADNYLKHTTIGDPELDPIMEELSAERWIQATSTGSWGPA